ncbi:glycosyltransferase family 4 protein [Halomonas sp. MMSF_3323]|uniref:glycosyltransferase family 4 protein n=1 Tax=Halomonas sp. MMSF_3323 TaxID=3046701 RepID=UPI00273FBB33|nr:glycosyltransferase family 4 protein [Halomonas sp. MMSF_3323]
MNSFFSKGGASRAAIRLVTALQKSGVTAEYLSVYPEKLGVFSKLILYFRASVDRIPVKFFLKKKVLFSTGRPSNTRLLKKINASDADVVHLHWINTGGMSVEDIFRINKPIVWSLHDMWPFTGGCHYDDNCDKYVNGCGDCPMLKGSSHYDASYKLVKRKMSAVERRDHKFVVNGLSSWIADCASKSSIFCNSDVRNLPNPINTSVFSPQGKDVSRSYLGLPLRKKLIMFGAISALTDPRKGYLKLVEALACLPKDDNVELVVFGSDSPAPTLDLGFNAHYLGSFSSDVDLVALYSAADVMIVPSLQENLSNSILESLSCGTPVVAFDIGGNSDMIDHKLNGYLVKPFKCSDLSLGIQWVLDSQEKDTLSKNSRNKVVENFDERVVSSKYIELYSEIV